MATDLKGRGRGRASEPEGPRRLAVLGRLRRAAAPPGRASPGRWSWISGEATPPFVLLVATTATLIVLGLVMIFSASLVRSTAETGGNAFGTFGHQLLYCLLGLPVLVAGALLDYRRWRPLALPLLLVALAACALVLVPGIGAEVNSVRRWFDLGPVSFQPSELLKLAVPLGVSALLAKRWSRIRRGDLHALLMPSLPLLAFGALLVLAGPDLETALLVVAIGGAALWVAGAPGRLVTAGTAAAFAVGLLGIMTSGMRRGRILAWLDPTVDPSHLGYQQLQGYMALGSGGVFGVGLGRSRAKWLYLPNPETDFIFAVVGEELGLLGAMTVLLLFLGIAIGGTVAARRAPDPFGRLLAISLTAWLLLQATVNIGSVVGLLPVTGVPLPLVSYGGSSLLFTMAGVGLLLSVARAASVPRAKDER